jgi:polyhydroxybutyrate depolymerase
MSVPKSVAPKKTGGFRKWFRIVMLALILLVGLGIGGFALVMQPGPLRLTSGGVERTYRVYVPRSYDPLTPAPLLIMFHQMYALGAQAEGMSGFNPLADREGFIVVYPDSYGSGWADRHTSNEANAEGIDDVAFTADLIEAVASHNNIDRERVVVSGMSAGGFFVQHLACHSEQVTGIAAVGALMPSALADDCPIAHPVDVLLIFGSEDRNIGAGGVDMGINLPAAETAQAWAAINGCDAEPARSDLPDSAADGTRVHEVRYSGCDGGVEVVFYDVQGGGHKWPGGSVLWQPPFFGGRASGDISASAEIWAFFSGQ